MPGHPVGYNSLPVTTGKAKQENMDSDVLVTPWLSIWTDSAASPTFRKSPTTGLLPGTHTYVNLLQWTPSSLALLEYFSGQSPPICTCKSVCGSFIWTVVSIPETLMCILWCGDHIKMQIPPFLQVPRWTHSPGPRITYCRRPGSSPPGCTYIII